MQRGEEDGYVWLGKRSCSVQSNKLRTLKILKSGAFCCWRILKLDTPRGFGQSKLGKQKCNRLKFLRVNMFVSMQCNAAELYGMRLMLVEVDVERDNKSASYCTPQ
ncbi:hypothetical protein TWF173_008627 [Orbilia oligospora]|nr:hypothetical protein TWF173_008627 [Orbilia oligospora]